VTKDSTVPTPTISEISGAFRPYWIAGREIGEQRSEAVHRQAVFGQAHRLLFDSSGRALGLRYDAFAQRWTPSAWARR
jgi:hypothetical protein